jgi:hypothetical protein
VNALEGYVHVDIIKTLNAFLDFCYIACQNVLTEDSLNALDTALEWFHHYREIFRISGVRPDGFSLPRQHALKHYRCHIENFGAPNGLCSSITESKHITAVKKPWRRSSRYEALQQMLTINTRNDKLAAARVDFSSRGMLRGTCLGEVLQFWNNVSNNVNDNDNDYGNDNDNDSGNNNDNDSGNNNNNNNNNEEYNGPDGNGEGGSDLDIDDDNGDDNNGDGSPGPVDGPPVLSEVVLAQKRGKEPLSASSANPH